MATETVPRVDLPGGEMPAWSDLAGGRAAGGDPLAALAARVVPAGARVLFAGPHHPELLARLAYAEVTCLLRGVPDADRLADAPARLVVGGPDGLDGSYDVVVAAAGLDALESVEGTPLGWSALLDRLVAVLRPGGLLLLRADNPVGLGRLVDTTPWYAGRDDARWAVSGVLDATRPATLDQLRARLTAAGLHPWGSFAAYPDPGAATALLATGPLADRPTSGLFDAVLHAACSGDPADRPVLQDPARLAVDALHAGLAAALAPGWLLLAHRPLASTAGPAPAWSGDGGYAAPAGAGDGDDAAPAGARDDPAPAAATGPPGPAVASAPDRITLPVALVRAGSPADGVTEVYDGADGWRWRALAPSTTAPTAPGAAGAVAHREPTALTGRVAEGRLLRTLLLDATLRRDLTALRALLTGYADWLAGQSVDGRLAGAAAVAGVDNVVCPPGGGYAVLDPSWHPVEPLAVEVVLARSLWRFAADLLTGGYAHPWTSTLDVAGLTVVLGGLAGRDLDRATVARAVEVEAAVTAARRGLDDAGRDDLAAGLRAVEPTAPPAGTPNQQQLHEAWRRRGEELDRLTALLTWTQDLLDHRERALRRAEAKLDLLSGTLGYKVGRMAITPLRMARRGAGAAKRQVRTAVRQHKANKERS
ncbi:class I SAM-dependent methyltransferase [Micromonospora fluostatini]|uniref:Class I SAM-dependent methyltransferase n=1 Tax=Micromonospora fluostatini TaxID=1629071 RepID=A0ABY2DL54_9ACTN|nr:class I SAM-dependent methyltransferase [Micromonospora fluostatini]